MASTALASIIKRHTRIHPAQVESPKNKTNAYYEEDGAHGQTGRGLRRVRDIVTLDGLLADFPALISTKTLHSRRRAISTGAKI